jgi:hypothetical protein
MRARNARFASTCGGLKGRPRHASTPLLLTPKTALIVRTGSWPFSASTNAYAALVVGQRLAGLRPGRHDPFLQRLGPDANLADNLRDRLLGLRHQASGFGFKLRAIAMRLATSHGGLLRLILCPTRSSFTVAPLLRVDPVSP